MKCLRLMMAKLNALSACIESYLPMHQNYTGSIARVLTSLLTDRNNCEVRGTA